MTAIEIFLLVAALLAWFALVFFKGPDFIELVIDTVAQITVKVERKTKRALRRWREIFGR